MKLLSQIRKDMEFNQDLYGLIDVLKAIAISQYRVLEKRIKLFDKFSSALENLFSLINIDKAEHPLLNAGDRKPGVIAVTSDAGLIGGLNAQVMNLALKEVTSNQVKLLVIGERGKIYAKDKGIPFTGFAGINDEARLFQAQQLRDYILSQELSRKLGALKIIYPYPLSIVSQGVKILQLIPFSKEDMKIAPSTPRPKDRGSEGLILESSVSDIAGYLVYLLLGEKFYEIFGLSRLAELSARFVHLENSKTKIEQLNKQLKLQYFRQRHELIDRNMRELFTARLQFK